MKLIHPDVRAWAAARIGRPMNAILEVDLVVENDDDGDPNPAVRVDYLDLTGERERTIMRFTYHPPLSDLYGDIRATAQAAKTTAEWREHMGQR